jgi:hypothetical protein
MRKPFPALGLSAIVLLAGLTGVPAPARADTLLIERVAREDRAAKPVCGQTMATVRARFGAPAEELPPVGGDRPRHPPITRWVYPAFTVYFERDRVIDAVANRSSALEQGPKPVE